MRRGRLLSAAATLGLVLVAVPSAAQATPQFQASIEPTVDRMAAGAALLVHVHVTCPGSATSGFPVLWTVRVDQATGPSTVQHDEEGFILTCDGQSHGYAVPVLIPNFVNNDLNNDDNLSPRGWIVGSAVVRVQDESTTVPTVYATSVVKIRPGTNVTQSAPNLTIAPSYRLIAAGVGLRAPVRLTCPAGSSAIVSAANSQASTPSLGQRGYFSETITCTGAEQSVPMVFGSGGQIWRAKPTFVTADICVGALTLGSCAFSWRTVTPHAQSH